MESKVRLTLQWVTCSLPKLYGKVKRTIPKEELSLHSIDEWETILLSQAAETSIRKKTSSNITTSSIQITFLKSSFTKLL